MMTEPQLAPSPCSPPTPPTAVAAAAFAGSAEQGEQGGGARAGARAEAAAAAAAAACESGAIRGEHFDLYAADSEDSRVTDEESEGEGEGEGLDDRDGATAVSGREDRGGVGDDHPARRPHDPPSDNAGSEPTWAAEDNMCAEDYYEFAAEANDGGEGNEGCRSEVCAGGGGRELCSAPCS
jgi:hypothetical protein